MALWQHWAPWQYWAPHQWGAAVEGDGQGWVKTIGQESVGLSFNLCRSGTTTIWRLNFKVQRMELMCKELRWPRASWSEVSLGPGWSSVCGGYNQVSSPPETQCVYLTWSIEQLTDLGRVKKKEDSLWTSPAWGSAWSRSSGEAPFLHVTQTCVTSPHQY